LKNNVNSIQAKRPKIKAIWLLQIITKAHDSIDIDASVLQEESSLLVLETKSLKLSWRSMQNHKEHQNLNYKVK
jgi:hypothetical protein